MEGWLFLLFPLILVLAIAGIWLSYVKQKQRREEMGRLADELSWEFSSASDYDHNDRYAHFAAFQEGHSQYAFNTLEGAIEQLADQDEAIARLETAVADLQPRPPSRTRRPRRAR